MKGGNILVYAHVDVTTADRKEKKIFKWRTQSDCLFHKDEVTFGEVFVSLMLNAVVAVGVGWHGGAGASRGQLAAVAHEYPTIFDKVGQLRPESKIGYNFNACRSHQELLSADSKNQIENDKRKEYDQECGSKWPSCYFDLFQTGVSRIER